MKVLTSIAELATVPGPVFLAIGVFDGVHLGHKAVIQRALVDAKKAGGTAVVVTFDPHPMRTLRPEHAPRLLTSTPHKIRLIRELGISHLLMIHFDRAFAGTAPEDFILSLSHAGKPLREICVGHQWSFGKNRAGNLEMLKTWGGKLGFDEVGVQAVTIDGEVVSSTLIRGLVEAGDLAKAARLLGREFTVYGTVVEGKHLGRQLGFPTANLRTHNEQFPPDGVYAVEAFHNGETHRGVVNIGVRPTVEKQAGERLLEVHLFDFEKSIYGEDIEVAFRKFLRPEKKFAGLDELKAQIAQDAKDARSIFS
ncbi:MAG TPA: bifunctional riboflavin kinase/FAD synthetase [Chthoniobacteraceae bacterium]|nr:bifunctional riboflavin kinase/FAD synthetase [Chthoniobacteraceae bacterium]